jgi:uncharacterized protein (DUF58 family)
MSNRLTPLGWITGCEGALLCLVPAWQAVPLAAAGGVAMLAAVGVARLLAPRALTGVRGEWVLPRAVHAHAETTLAARLSCDAAVPPLHLWAWDPRLRAPREVARLAGVGPSPCGARWTARFPNRGAVQLPALEITGVQPLGLIETRRACSDGVQLIVLPSLGRVRAGLRARLAEWFAGVAVAPEPGGDDLGRLRTWTPGDPSTRIHWRASARHQQLLVAERHAPAARRLAIALDPLASSPVFERLVSAAATLIDDLDRRGWELAVHHGQATRGVSGTRERLLETLALCRPGGAPIDEVIPRGMPCLTLLADTSRTPDSQPPPLVIRDGELPRLIHLPRRLGRADA